MAENKDIDSVERSSRSAMSQMSKFLRKCVIHRTRYRLGQALDMTLELRQAAPASYIHAIAIFPDAKSEYGKVFISIECGTTPDQLPRIEPVIESMIQRIRLVPAGK